MTHSPGSGITSEIFAAFGLGLAAAVAACWASPAAAAIVENDTLEAAVRPPLDFTKFLENTFHIYGAEAVSLDDNIYRVSPGTDLSALPAIGTDPHRSDRINDTTAGLQGQWNRGRQTVSVDLRVDDDRFDHNDDLNNVSTADKVDWRYDVGDVLTGQVGATYSRGLIPFTNAGRYDRDLYAVTQYFAAGRIQVGPRWALFGGVLQSGTTLSDVSLRANDSHAKSVALGTEYQLGMDDSIGVEYRYTDSRYPQGVQLNDDYREDAGRVLFRYALSQKTNIDAEAGFLKRNYASEVIGRFSGDVWRVNFNWLPTEKIKVEAGTWRNLQAWLTEQSSYYVSKGVRVGPDWIPTEKIVVAVAASYEIQDYIGVTPTQISLGSRQDKITSGQASVSYTPLKFLIFDLSYAYEKRASNEALYRFDDNIVTAKVTLKY